MIKIGFMNRGIACPQCGYVFTNGLSDVTGIVPNNPRRDPLQPEDHAVTVCTGCGAVLEMKNGGFRVVSPIEEMLWPREERENIAAVRRLLQRAFERIGRGKA